MNHRSLDDIDRAVLLARRAATAGHLDRPEPLSRFLYQHWYLGRAPRPHPPAAPSRQLPAQRAPAPGPWRTWGPLWATRSCRGEELVRLYLSCAPRTSLHVVGAVTVHAQRWDVPWLLSSRAMSQPVPTPDATVLYLPAQALPELRDVVTRMVEDVQPFLSSTLPAMTLRIARGASLAQNTPDGRPFGEHRCSLIAGTVLTNSRCSHRETVDRTVTAFRRAGIDPQHPYRALDASWEWSSQRLAA